MTITINDVARECGVNVSTVSRVLNNDARISATTRTLVQNKIKELGYKPLRKKRQGTQEIILAIPNIGIYTLGNTLNYMSIKLHEKNYDIRIVNLNQQRDITPDIAKMLCKKDPSGIIMYGCYVPEESANIFYQMKIPTVVRHGRTQHLISVSVSNYNGMQDATNYVISRGYKKIGFVGWNPIDHNCKIRLDSFVNALDDVNLDGSMTAFKSLDITGGYDATKALMEAHKPEAIVYSADIMAYGGIEYLRLQGLSYPNDIGLIGFDDAPLSKVIGLTSMYELIEETASLIMENLLTMIERKEFLPPKEILLTPKLIIRDSLK